MTQRPLDEAGWAAGESGNQRDGATPVAQDPGTALDQVRQNAALLLSVLSHPPRALRMRAGEVAIEIEWDTAVTGLAGPIHRDQPTPANDGDDRQVLTAQAVGVFYRAPEPDAEPFVSEGDTVLPGQQLAIIEAMKLMIPVEADLSGKVLEVLKGDGEPVEYGEPLFLFAAAEHS
jgi:acetyl-CoA carboxylase biotin carboxyl carrier protein